MASVIEQVVVQLPVAAAKLLLLEEEAVVHEGQGIEDVEFQILGQNQGIVAQFIHTSLVGRAVVRLSEAGFGGVVPHISDTQHVVLVVLNDRGFDAVEGEEICNVLVVVLKKERKKLSENSS